MNDPKILILYARYGDGHLQASMALQQEFHDRGVGRVVLADLMAQAHPRLYEVTRRAYLISSAYSPHLYGWSYYLTDGMRPNRVMSRRFHSMCMGQLQRLIEAEQPDAVIHTFPLLTMFELRKRTGGRIPTYTVLTDFVSHGRWLHPETDKYFVATDDLKQTLIEKGTPAERILVSGIPIRQSFRQPVDPGGILHRYGLEPHRATVLVMAGAYGILSHTSKIVRALLELEHIQIVLICGKNKSMLSHMQACYADEPRVRPLGFVENVHELMAVSACLISKAGGITLAESLALQLPLVIYRPLPGQELGNARYLAGQGALRIAQEVDGVKEHVRQLVTDVAQTTRMKSSMRALQAPDAADRVVSEVLDGIKAAWPVYRGAVPRTARKADMIWGS